MAIACMQTNILLATYTTQNYIDSIQCVSKIFIKSVGFWSGNNL